MEGQFEYIVKKVEEQADAYLTWAKEELQEIEKKLDEEMAGADSME